MKTQTISRKVCLIGSFFFLLSSNVSVIQPAIGDLFRKAGSSIKTTVERGLQSAYQKFSGIKTEKIIDSLLGNVRKLGSQIGKIKSCMLSSQGTCSSSERAAFYATAITILALTAVIVGFTITVAATSKESDEELNRAIETTSQEVKGWKPAAVFQRLSNKLTSFKQSLLSMRQCLIKRRCTKKQKRALYATAATIVALVTIAIGIGVGSYLYTKKKEAQEKQQLLLATQEAGTGVSTQELDKALQQLSVDQTEEALPGATTRFQEKIQTGIAVQKEGGNVLQVKAREITSALQRKAQKAIEALRRTPDKAMKLALFQEAKEALDKAKEIARNFVATVRNFSLDDMINTIQNVLGINVVPATNLMLTVKNNSMSSIKFLTNLGRTRLTEQVNKLTMDNASFVNKLFALMEQFQFQSEESKLLEAIKDKLAELVRPMLDKKIKAAKTELSQATTEPEYAKVINRLAAEVTQETDRLAEAHKERERQVRTTEERIFIRQEFLNQLDQELRDLLRSEGKPLPPVPIEKEYPFWQTLQEVWAEYPQLLNQLNGLSISTPGQLIASVLEDTSSTLEQLQQLRTALPTIGPKIISDELSGPLKILQTQLQSLAQNISNITSIHPLVHTEGAPANWALFYATVKQLVRGKFFTITERATELLRKVKMQNGQLQNELTQLQEAAKPLGMISSTVKTKFVSKLTNTQEDVLLRNVSKAPKLLRNAIGETITDIKIALNNILDSSSTVIYRLGNMLQYTDGLLRTINDFMGSTPDKPFITHAVIQAIEPIASNTAGMAITIERIRTILAKEKNELRPIPIASTPAA